MKSAPNSSPDRTVTTLPRLFACLILLLPAALGRSEVSMSTLQSLPAVGVEISGLPAAADAFALTEDNILVFVRDILQRNEVTLIGGEALSQEPGRPILRVSVLLTQVRGPSHLYRVDLKLRELVVPVRPLDSLVELPAITWHRQSAGIANRGQTVLDALGKMVEDFAAEYRREN